MERDNLLEGEEKAAEVAFIEDDITPMTPNDALENAVECLVDAANISRRQNDAATMLNCAAGWLEISDRLSGNTEPKGPIGFGSFGKKGDTDDESVS